jgi:hypothetical protein
MPLDHVALIFQNPKPWSVEELRKLAPAILPPDGNVGLWHFEKQKLNIWGMQTSGPPGVTFEVLEPGRIVVSFPISSRVAEVTLQRAGFISFEWQKGGSSLMSNNHAIKDISQIQSVLSYFPIYAKQEILQRMRLLRHGGTLIFVPDNRGWEKSVEKPETYTCAQPLNQISPIENYLRNKIIALEKENGLSLDDKNRKSIELLTEPKLKAFLGDAARSIAYLSAVDGAVILNKDLSVLSFGAKLKTSRKTPQFKTVISISPLESELGPNEIDLDDAFRGTRHLSAARFVADNPKAIAFVVSQDGAITGFKVGQIGSDQQVPKLLAYRNLELLL